MVTVFRQLLKDYPDGPGAAQANYWIGWAASESQALPGCYRAVDPDLPTQSR